MKSYKFIVAAAIGAAFMAGQAFAFTCPLLQKEANESISKAETTAAKLPGEREKGRAEAMIAEAKDLVKHSVADHKEAGVKKDAGLHYRAEAEAKAAKALAELVK